VTSERAPGVRSRHWTLAAPDSTVIDAFLPHLAKSKEKRKTGQGKTYSWGARGAVTLRMAHSDFFAASKPVRKTGQRSRRPQERTRDSGLSQKAANLEEQRHPSVNPAVNRHGTSGCRGFCATLYLNLRVLTYRWVRKWAARPAREISRGLVRAPGSSSHLRRYNIRRGKSSPLMAG